MNHSHEGREQSAIPSLVYGRDIVPADLVTINYHRVIEFNDHRPIVIEPGNEEWDKPYFLLREEDELKAFARLHSVEVAFSGHSYNILGIATVIAIDKGRGYGSKLMEDMKRFVSEDGRTAIGFCDPAVTSFYRRNGFTILDEGEGLFTFYNENMEVVEPDYPGSDVLCLPGTDGLIDDILVHPAQPVMAFRPAW